MIWLDAHLPPALATWLTAEMGQPAAHLRALGLRHAKDREIFAAARAVNAVPISKDADFVQLVQRLGPPPAIIWLTCGNTSNAGATWLARYCLVPRALGLIEGGEPLVEISDSSWP